MVLDSAGMCHNIARICEKELGTSINSVPRPGVAGFGLNVSDCACTQWLLQPIHYFRRWFQTLPAVGKKDYRCDLKQKGGVEEDIG